MVTLSLSVLSVTGAASLSMLSASEFPTKPITSRNCAAISCASSTADVKLCGQSATTLDPLALGALEFKALVQTSSAADEAESSESGGCVLNEQRSVLS